MPTISNDNPCYYFTSVAVNRLPVFQTDKIKKTACGAINEARNSGGFLIFAYVIMPDHIHLITDGKLKPSKTLQYINGIAARRIIDYLKENNYESSLQKLRHRTLEGNYKYSLWEHHPNKMLLTGENVFLQKVNYIHLNPLRAGLVEKAEDYLYSSFRIWAKRRLENEPLEVDIDKIVWREAEPRRRF
jgi:putative transposase